MPATARSAALGSGRRVAVAPFPQTLLPHSENRRETYLRLTHVEGGPAQLRVDNGKFDLFVTGSYKMSLIVGGKRRPIGLGKGGTSYNAGLSLWAESGLLAQLRGATALEVDRPDGTLLERLDLGGLAPALGRLPECIAQAAMMPPGPTFARPPAASTPASAVGRGGAGGRMWPLAPYFERRYPARRPVRRKMAASSFGSSRRNRRVTGCTSPPPAVRPP